MDKDLTLTSETPQTKRSKIANMGFLELNGERFETPFPCEWAPAYLKKVWPRRVAPPTGIVSHETAGPTAGSALNSWINGPVGADLIIDTDGSVIQCADPLRSAPWHASGWSPSTIGIEVVCPVTDRSPYSKPAGAPWSAPWADSPRVTLDASTPFESIPSVLGRFLYVPPFRVQRETFVALVQWLKENIPSLAAAQILDPLAWRLTDKTPRAGIIAHGQVAADRRDGYGCLLELANAMSSTKVKSTWNLPTV